MSTPNILTEFYEFSPLDDMTAEDIINLWKAMKITFYAEAWAKLDEKTRRHFIVKKRTGEAHRYGKASKVRQALNQRPTE